jgi:hypothetical protein
MPIHFDYETDTLYLKGAEKEAAKNHRNFARNLILDTDLSDEKIASLVGVTIEYVKKLRLELKP